MNFPHITFTPAESSSIASPYRQGTIADVLRLLGTEDLNKPDVADAARMVIVEMLRVSAGKQLIHMNAPSIALYIVCTGTFKIFHIDEDGYEQVLSFAVRSEVIGLDALYSAAHPTAASALEDSSVYVIYRSALPSISRNVPIFNYELQRAGSRALARANELVYVMAAVASEVRLARFLLQLSLRLSANGQSPKCFHLRMGRRDIASMLGVAHETVSRSFTMLSMAGLLHVDGRDVEILDVEKLREYSRCTRRPPEEALISRAHRQAMPNGGTLRLSAPSPDSQRFTQAQQRARSIS